VRHRDPQTFWRSVDQSSGSDACWGWTGARNRKGYGVVKWQGQLFVAHRLAWTLTSGPIVDDSFVLHRCDNPPCCNPAHLFLGTAADNTADAIAKGRLKTLFPAGERHPLARLTDADAALIRQMREAGVPLKEIAARFGIATSHVSKVSRGVVRGPANPPERERGAA
jgi:hypothetical protein